MFRPEDIQSILHHDIHSECVSINYILFFRFFSNTVTFAYISITGSVRLRLEARNCLILFVTIRALYVKYGDKPIRAYLMYLTRNTIYILALLVTCVVTVLNIYLFILWEKF